MMRISRLSRDVLEQRRAECAEAAAAKEAQILQDAAEARLSIDRSESERRAEYEQERRDLLASMCEHMRALIEHCISVGVEFGGCGDCGSAWLYCRKCHLQVDKAHDAFEPGPYEAD